MALFTASVKYIMTYSVVAMIIVIIMNIIVITIECHQQGYFYHFCQSFNFFYCNLCYYYYDYYYKYKKTILRREFRQIN